MSIYTKLNEARTEFHTLKLEKTGRNKFAGYRYFELGDFLIPALQVFKKHGLCGVVSFGADLATLTIVDVETPGGNPESIAITSPMSTAALKGCHEVQNLGAVQTYLRRYLWVSALEIVEHDAVNASVGNKNTARSAMVETFNQLDDAQQSAVEAIAKRANKQFADGDIQGAVQTVNSVTDVEEGIALWTLIPQELKKAAKALPADRQAIVEKVYSAMLDHFNNDDVAGAFEEYSGVINDKEKAALWGKLGKAHKTAISDFGRNLKNGN